MNDYAEFLRTVAHDVEDAPDYRGVSERLLSIADRLDALEAALRDLILHVDAAIDQDEWQGLTDSLEHARKLVEG